MSDKKIYQEFYCTTSGGGCGGYILCKINMAINGIVEVVCPKCGHKHQRYIKDGEIIEDHRFSGKPTQEICPTIAAWSDKRRTSRPQTSERNAVVIRNQNDFLQELKNEYLGVPT